MKVSLRDGSLSQENRSPEQCYLTVILHRPFVAFEMVLVLVLYKVKGLEALLHQH